MDQSADNKTVVLVVGIDDDFAAPLLVMLRSACRNLSPGWGLEVFILEHQVSQASRELIDSGLSGFPVRVRWRTPDLRNVRARLPEIRVEGEVSVYFRLLIGEALPERVEHVIYLDTDIMVEGDLVELWNLPFDGHLLQAAPDAYAGTLHIPRLRSIAAEASLGFGDGATYFNAGVQLIDLRAWREERTGERALDLLLEHGNRLLGRDQDALNLILTDRWKPLPPSWNFHELPQCLFLWECGTISTAELKRTFQSPQIVHFIGHWQPWGHSCSQKYQEHWRQVAREAGVAQERPPLLQSLWHRLIREPHSRLNWFIWRNVIQAPDPGEWHRIAMVVLMHPWMVVTYPLWQAKVWLDFRVRKPLRRWLRTR